MDSAPAAESAAPATVPVSLPVRDVGQVTINLVDGQSGKAWFCLGVRKSGSTMLHKIIHFLARRNNVNAVDIPGSFFKAGFVVTDWLATDVTQVVRPGNVYVGFRSFPTNMAQTPVFQDGRKILMFRDPRDALVSQYFSDAYSHSLPSSETAAGAKASQAFLAKRAETLATDIDSYVLKHSRAFQNTLLPFEPLLTDPSCLVLRYEDYVFQKKRLIYKTLKHFEWDCMPGQVESLLKQIDEVPNAEDSKRFVRRVIPGDHRNKLKEETIRRLNHQMRQALQVFDYY